MFTSPSRDVRRHTASVCYHVSYDPDRMGAIAAGDDAKVLAWKEAGVILTTTKQGKTLQFDHDEIVRAWKDLLAT